MDLLQIGDCWFVWQVHQTPYEQFVALHTFGVSIISLTRCMYLYGTHSSSLIARPVSSYLTDIQECRLTNINQNQIHLLWDMFPETH